MSRSLLLCACSLLLVASQAAGRTEYRLGGEGNPWQLALSASAGSYITFAADGRELRRTPVGTTPLGAGGDTLIDFSGTSIRPRYIDPDVNMALTDPDSPSIEIPLPYIGGQGNTTDGCSAAGQQTPIIKKMFDGDVNTAHFRRFTQSPNANPGIGEGWGRNGSSAAVVDMGAAVPVNRIRFYPRLGREEDRMLIEEFADPKPPLESFGEDSFVENFLAWFEIRIGDDSEAFARSPCDRISGLRWVRAGDSRLQVLIDTRENLDPMVDLRFTTRSIRWITIRPFPLRNWEVAEFEVYGEGFVEKTVYISRILDFGRPINWGKIRWQAEAPEGTRVEIRTRTGSTPDPSRYFTQNINGDLREITLGEYNKIDPTGRLPTVYNVQKWSFWSPPYNFESGRRDPSKPAAAWEDGTPLLSPGPSRYIQVAIRLFSTFSTAPHIDQLSLQFSESPSAQQVVGEIWPIEVQSFAPTPFTYVVRPTFGADDIGFDRLEIRTPTRVQTLSSLKIDGTEVDRNRFPPEILADRIVLAFPTLGGEDDSFKQIEVEFEASVLRFGSEFTGFVFNSTDPDRIKQQIKPGNATFRFSGDILAVKTPVGGDLLVDLEAAPNPFTPNGDGINDQFTLSFKLREVAVERPVTLSIYELSGTLVRKLPPLLSVSGERSLQWDGRDDEGQMVPPGNYVYRLDLGTEESEEKLGVVSLVY